MAQKRNRGRSKAVYVRLFQEEWNILEKKARLIGKTKSDYLRDIILLGEVKEKPVWQDENFKRLLYEINKIGNNLNQISYNSNLKKSTGREEIYALREQYESLLSLYEDTFLYPESEVKNGDDEES